MSADNVILEKEDTKPFPSPSVDWDSLREQSLQPGGFAERRVHLWPLLLGVDDTHPEDLEPTLTQESGHPDERQIRLDTSRSFVLYPDDSSHSGDTREKLQSELHNLLVSIFRRRRKLRYFQGYHDIITVLFLTLPPSLRLPCAEQLSLHRLRDSMGMGLEPVVGLLHVLKNLLRLVDPSYATSIESVIPLPYYALSNLLTLFSHDIPTLALIQHLFDYILCRPPLCIVYVATALILAQKQDVELLEEQDEEGMIHSLLNRLPTIVDSSEDVVLPNLGEQDASIAPSDRDISDPGALGSATPASTLVELTEEEDKSEESLPQTNNLTGPKLDPEPFRTYINGDSSMGEEKHDTSAGEETRDDDATVDGHEPPEEDTATASDHDDSDSTSLHNCKEDPVSSRPLLAKKPAISLCSLLRHSDELFALYPPTHPSLALSTIMGPQSVVFTWSTDFKQLPPDDEAEAMVEHPDLIVRPPPGPDEVPEEPKQPRPQQRSTSQSKAIWAGAILVVGVAAVVYGLRTPEGIRTLEALKSKGWRHVGNSWLRSRR